MSTPVLPYYGLFPGSEYDADSVEFMLAMERYIREQRRRFPTWQEALAVARSLGYRKVETATKLPAPPAVQEGG